MCDAHFEFLDFIPDTQPYQEKLNEVGDVTVGAEGLLFQTRKAWAASDNEGNATVSTSYGLPATKIDVKWNCVEL